MQIPATNTAAVVNIVRALQSYPLANPAQQNAINGVTAALSDAKSQQHTKRLSREASQLRCVTWIFRVAFRS